MIRAHRSVAEVYMAVALRIIDETPGRERRFVRELRLASERLSLRELLRRRIECEAAEREARITVMGWAPSTPSP